MTPMVFLLAVGGLLISPGPTNALLAIGGATRGFTRALPLIGAALAGYLLVIVPLALVGRVWLSAHPDLALVLRVIAAGWVLYLAARLWRAQASGAGGLVSFRQVFVTTLLNPKALVIGLALLPAATPAGLLPWLAAVAASIAAVSLLWIATGALLGRASAGTLPPLLRRGAAVYLAVVACGLAASVL